MLFVLWVCLSTFNKVRSQAVLQTKDAVQGFMSLPTERVSVHTNAYTFLTGEYLYYNLFCFDNDEDDLSKFSKVAYVELVGKNLEPLFKHKITLENGLGQGDFFIPTDVDSDTYKLIAYTNWMRNQGLEDFYQSDITIINPYRSNQPQLLKKKPILRDSLNRMRLDTLPQNNPSPTYTDDIGPLQIVVDGERFVKRQKVSLVLNGVSSHEKISGNYSLSVRKKELFLESPRVDDFYLSARKNTAGAGYKQKVSIGDTIVLPELRGELYQGSVVALQNGASVRNLKVAVSIPGEDYVLDVVQTDVLGNFIFNIAQGYSGDNIVLEVVGQNPEAYKIVQRQLPSLNYGDLEFKELQVNLQAREEVLRRSIHNQIENSYFQFRPDSVLKVSPELFFDIRQKKTYILDDYNRFRTLGETFVEIIKDAFSKKMGKDDFAIRVKGYDYASILDIPPLLVVDGCIVQDHNALLNFNASVIEEVTIYRDNFIIGPELYEGAITIKTKSGAGYTSLKYEGAMSIFNILKPQQDKKYFVQRYDERNDNNNLRLPDDRVQLLWMPKLKLKKNELRIDFYTSDVIGEFEIGLKGITDDKKWVAVRKSIFVD